VGLLFRDDEVERLVLGESAVAFEERLHPRGRHGQWVPKIGDIVRRAGTSDHYKVTGFHRGNAVLLNERMHTTTHAHPSELTLHKSGGVGVDIQDRPQQGVEFPKGARVVLPDGREATVSHKTTGGRESAGWKAHRDNYIEPHYAVHVPGEGNKTFSHSDLSFHPDEMATRVEKIAELVSKGEKKPTKAAMPTARGPVTLRASVVPDEWQVENGYGTFENPRYTNPSEGDRVKVMPSSTAFDRHRGKSGVVVKNAYSNRSSTLIDVRFDDGETHAISNQVLMGEDQKPWVRMKPGVDVEKMIYHYLTGHPAPPNPAKGTDAYAQWTYTGSGGKKADREALVRKITQALALRTLGGTPYVEVLVEACALRAALGEHVDLTEGMSLLGEAYDERLHPRGRAGQWTAKLGKIATLHRQLGGNSEVQKALDKGDLHAGDTERLIALAQTAKRDNPKGSQHHEYVHGVASELEAHARDAQRHMADTKQVKIHAPSGKVETDNRLTNNVGRSAQDRHRRLHNEQVAKDEKAVADHLSPGYVAGKGADESDLSHLVANFVKMHGRAPTPVEMAKIKRRKPEKKPGSKMSRREGHGLLTEGSAAADFQVPWNESLHPRNRKGEFAQILGRLARGESAHLPHGVSVKRGLVGGFTITQRGKDPQHALDTERAADKALQRVDNEARQRVRVGFSHRDEAQHARDREALGAFHPGEPRDGSTIAGRGRDGSLVVVAQTRHIDLVSNDAKVQAMIDSGLADSVADAKAQLADMGELRRSGGHVSTRVSLAHFTADRYDDSKGEYVKQRVHQASLNGAPLHPETTDEAHARDLATKAVNDYTQGKIAGVGKKRVSFEEWDGDAGKHVQEPTVIEPGGAFPSHLGMGAQGKSGFTVWKGDRLEGLKRIVERHQAHEIDGHLVDVQTANLLLKVHDALSPGNKAKFGSVPLSRLVDLAWQAAS
jgi:hypothetical protein